MRPTTPSLAPDSLHDRRQAIAAGWFQAIAEAAGGPAGPAELRSRLDVLSMQAVGILLSDPFDPRQAAEIGASLADLGSTETETLGQILEVLSRELLRDLPPDDAAALQPRLVAAASWLAAGFCRQSLQVALDGQEAAHGALVEQLRHSLEAQRQEAERALRQSERTARSLLRAPTDAAVLLDRDGTILDLNETFALRFGATVDELMGTRVWDLIPPEVLDERKGYVQSVFRSGKAVRFEDQRDGMWNDSVLYPILDEEGGVSSAAMLARDITQRKRAEAALRESERTARALLRAPHYLAALADREGVLIDANEAFALRFGRSVEELVGSCMWDLLPPDLAERRKGYVESVFESGQPLRVEDERLGTWFDNVVYPVLDEEGAVSRVAVLASDITERKRAEEELRRSLEEVGHGRRLVLALGQASHAVQSALTREEIYQTVGDQVKGLGYEAIVFSLDRDRKQMVIPYMTFDATPLRVAEKLTGLPAVKYRFPLEPDGFFQQAVAKADTVYADEVVSAIAETLPEPLRPRAGRLASMLGIEQAILAPLTVEGETSGLLVVAGSGLREADTAAVEAFANGTAIALTNARLYQEVRGAAAGLERRVAERTEALESEVAERRRVETGLRRAQQRAIHSNRFLLALSRAAGAVQRAGTPEDVYRTIGDEVEDAGFHAVVFALSCDKSQLTVIHQTWPPSLVAHAVRLAGMPVGGLSFPLAPGGFFQPVIEQGQTSFCERTADVVTRGVPGLGRSLLDRLLAMLGLERTIYAPLVMGGEMWGVLCIGGSDLTEADVHAVSLFANQAGIALEHARLMTDLNAGRERLRTLTQQVVDAQEEERLRLSRALHDEAGQALTALSISLDLIGADLPPEYGSLRRRIDDAAALTVTTMDRLRGLAQDLRPPALDAVGLNATLEDACRVFGRRTQLAIDYQGMDAPPLAEEVNICLYRFLQEALTNVARHARADSVKVALAHDAETISLSVEDNGRGFDAEAALASPDLPAGIGLLGMQERLEALDGRLEIASQPGLGARVAAHVPLGEEGA